ncbi:carbohydrate kinase family protein [Floccifex sp.]|uniref:carbohydrate kinase family protein n=1 Tax=Floccifex sp. TaxID=2815810 RepID=UPI003F0237DA
MSIVVIGAVFVDIKGYPFNTYIPKGRNVGRVVQVHGGVARNVAEDIANIELRPTFVSLVDNTGMGQDVLQTLKNHKVNTDYIWAVEDGMGTWLAIFDNDGDVIGSISKRPSLKPIANIIEENEEAIFKDCDGIIIELDMEKEIVKKVFNAAKKYQKDVYALVSNMSIAVERRQMIQNTACFVCNQQEAGIFFSEDYDNLNEEEMLAKLIENVKSANIPRMVVTMGEKGAVFATMDGENGICPSKKVEVKDTTGAGDAFLAGVATGLIYGKSMMDACKIGTRLASSVICTSESVCPRFLPSEFGLEVNND